MSDFARIGTAAWNIPSQAKDLFETQGTQLERYASVLNAVEVNSSFYREHKPDTYRKWAGLVPDHFRFSVKLSRYFTQEKRLEDSGPKLKESLRSISQLGYKWEVLLVQLPPSLEFDLKTTRRFLRAVRQEFEGEMVWEPRHLSWSKTEALEILSHHRVSYARADPERCPLTPSQFKRVSHCTYLRLHGSPEIYKSRYSEAFVKKARNVLRASAASHRPTWCIFDNTTFGHATENALELIKSI